MKMYLNLFDLKSLITADIILDTYRKQGKGKNIKHFVTILGIETQVFTENQVNHSRLFLGGVQITDKDILATYKKKGSGCKTEHYVEINGQETRVFTANQLSQNKLFLDNVKITDPAILATHKKKGTEHFVEINGQETRVFTTAKLSRDRLFLDGVQITDPAILATHKRKGRGPATKHYVEIDGQEKCVLSTKQLSKYRSRQALAETSNDQVFPGSTEIEEPEAEPSEATLNFDPGAIIDNLMHILMPTSNPSDAEENTNQDISADAAENQNEVDVADDAAFDVTDEDNDGESVDQPSFKKQRGTTSAPPVILFNSPMFFASQARLQNVSNDRSHDLTTTSSVYDQQKNCLKAMSNWLHATNLDVIQQQYTSCPAPIIRFKSDIASLCSTVIDNVLTTLIPEDMLTQENLMKLRYIKAFQYNSATPFDHQCLDRFIKCVENKMNSSNQPASQTSLWKFNLR